MNCEKFCHRQLFNGRKPFLTSPASLADEWLSESSARRLLLFSKKKSVSDSQGTTRRFVLSFPSLPSDAKSVQGHPCRDVQVVDVPDVCIQSTPPPARIQSLPVPTLPSPRARSPSISSLSSWFQSEIRLQETNWKPNKSNVTRRSSFAKSFNIYNILAQFFQDTQKKLIFLNNRF